MKEGNWELIIFLKTVFGKKFEVFGCKIGVLRIK